MKILTVPSTTLNTINSETIQFSAMVNAYTTIASIDVINNCTDADMLSKIGISNQANFAYVEKFIDTQIYKEIVKLDEKNDYEYIIVSNLQVLELIYIINPQLLKSKVISALMTESTDVETTVKILNESSMVKLPSEASFGYYQKRGLKNKKCYVELPIVNYSQDNKPNKIYDMIFVGEISSNNRTQDFFSLVARYPEKKFVIAYTNYSDNIEFSDDEFIKYGLNNLKNLTVFCNISNAATIDLIAQSKFSFALKTEVIETNNTQVPSSKIIEAISTNTYPIVKKTRLNQELLGIDYPYYIDSLDGFNFSDYEPSVELKYVNTKSSEFLYKQLKQQYKFQSVEDIPVYINEIPTLSETFNLFDLGRAVVTSKDDICKYLKQFGLKVKVVGSDSLSQYLSLEDVSKTFKEFREFENTIELPPALLKKLELHGVSLKDYKLVSQSNTHLDIKQINKLANTSFHFIVHSKREMLSAMNIIGNIECDYISFNIVTTFENEVIVSRSMMFNKPIVESIELHLKNYDISQLYQLAIGEEVISEKDNTGDVVIVNNIYPSYDNLYAHAFVHTRTKLYKKQGINPIVVTLIHSVNPIETYIYDNQLVIKCSRKGFKFLFGGDKNYTFGIHFINQNIYNTLYLTNPQNKKIVWFHGSDSLPAEIRAEFYKLSEKNAYKAYKNRDRLMKIQKKLLGRIFANPTYKSVFVSNWLKAQISERYELIEERVAVIPNSIDTSLFYYEPKKLMPEERIKFLTIKPFLLEYDIYANQLLVDAIKLASKEKWFDKCEFTIYGRGDGFKYYMNQLDQLNCNNIIYYEKFLEHEQIKKLHSEHHVCLHPNNQDTHGVSFYEAMSSGLVSINSDNSAKPEYCISGITGFLHKDGDAKDLCEIMGNVVENYNELDELRQAGHKSVVDQFGEVMITEKELAMLFSEFNL